MLVEVTMPKFGLMMQEAIISIWHKKPGDLIQKGEPLVTIETEKVNTEIEAPETGIIKRLFFNEGDVAAVAAVIAEIETT